MKEIAKYFEEKIQNIKFDTLERFYDKVYKYKEYSKDEYYQSEEIEEPENEDRFDVIFEKLTNNISENQKEDIPSNNDRDIAKTFSNDEDSLINDVQSNFNTTINQNISNENKIQNTTIDHKSGNNIPKKTLDNQNEKTQCPECNIELNSTNLKKHLCKVHHKNCDENNENAKNNQNASSNSIPNLANAISSHARNIDKDDEDVDPSIVINEEKYRKAHQKQFEKNLSRASEETKKRYESTKVKVGAKETKEFLKKQYKGYCQICGFTFNQKNNNGKYFVSFDWLSEKITKQKTNISESGTSLCLCARCHSGLKYGDFEANFLSKLKTIDLSKFTYDQFISSTDTKVESDKIPKCYDFIEMDMYKIPIRLLNKDQVIYYTEEHFLHFFNMLTLKEI